MMKVRRIIRRVMMKVQEAKERILWKLLLISYNGYAYFPS